MICPAFTMIWLSAQKMMRVAIVLSIYRVLSMACNIAEEKALWHMGHDPRSELTQRVAGKRACEDIHMIVARHVKITKPRIHRIFELIEIPRVIIVHPLAISSMYQAIPL